MALAGLRLYRGLAGVWAGEAVERLAGCIALLCSRRPPLPRLRPNSQYGEAVLSHSIGQEAVVASRTRTQDLVLSRTVM